MSGFAAMKADADAQEAEEEAPPVTVANVVTGDVTTIDPAKAATMWDEFEAAGSDTNHNHTFILAWGAEGTMKTGCVLNALTAEDVKNNRCVLAIDFDGGAAACRSAHHRDKLQNIRCLNPTVIAGEGRTSTDFPATHERVMDIGRTAIEWARKQQSPDYTGPRLSWFVVTGLDMWNEVCTTCMKIVDLDAAADGIAAAVNPQQLVGNRWNWQIRSIRYHQLTAICRALMQLGVKIYLETHEKVVYENNKETLNTTPSCEKNLLNMVNQIIHYSKEEERDDSGAKTGVVNYWATFDKSKMSLDLQGQRRLVGKTQPNAPGVFHGLPELSEGML